MSAVSRLPGLRLFVPVMVALTALLALGGVALAVINAGRPVVPAASAASGESAVVESRIRDLSAIAPVASPPAVPVSSANPDPNPDPNLGPDPGAPAGENPDQAIRAESGPGEFGPARSRLPGADPRAGNRRDPGSPSRGRRALPPSPPPRPG